MSLVLVASAIVTIHLTIDWQVQAVRLDSLVKLLGAAAPPLFVAATAFGVVLCAPTAIIVGIGSLAFGHLGGALYSLAGVTAGTACAFLVGRYVLRNWGNGILERRLPVFRVLASRRGPLPAIGLRLVFPFAPALDYAVGATTISLPDYLLGSFFGLLPRIFALSFFFNLVTRSDWLAVTSSVPAFLILVIMPLMRVCGIVLLTKLIRQSQKSLQRARALDRAERLTPDNLAEQPSRLPVREPDVASHRRTPPGYRGRRA